MKLMKNFNFVSSGFWVVSREGACCHHHDTKKNGNFLFIITVLITTIIMAIVCVWCVCVSLRVWLLVGCGKPNLT